MHNAQGCIKEIYLDDRRAARLECPPALIPAPGQYLLATCASDPDAPLAQPLFSAGPCAGGFYAAPPLPQTWLPGALLNLRGPLGHGFYLPPAARRVALAAFGSGSARLLALLEPALAQKAAVALLTDTPPAGLPAAIEISPLTALPETLRWADYLALDVPRAGLQALLTAFGPLLKGGYAQALIETPLPCAGLAECGACAVRTPRAILLACKDGPVIDL